MLRTLTSTLLLLLITQPLPAQQEPPEDLFNYSSRDLAFRVPPEFQLVAQNRKYLNPAAHEVPRFQRIWKHGSDGIVVSVVIWRDAAWQKTPKETFDQDGCPAESITCYYQSADGTSQRMDCFLAKPYVFMLAYVSPKPSSWDDSVSKAFFQTISLKPKK